MLRIKLILIVSFICFWIFPTLQARANTNYYYADNQKIYLEEVSDKKIYRLVRRYFSMNLFKSNSGAAQKRNLGSKRCVRFSISINTEYDWKLSRLSTSCGMSKSEMTDQLLGIALDSPNVIDWLQEQYNQVEEYKVHPIKINNKIHY